MAWTRNKRGSGSEFGQSKDLRYSKQCLFCGETFYKYVCSSMKRWEQVTKYCSQSCRVKHQHAQGKCPKFEVGHAMPTKGTAPSKPCLNCGKPILLSWKGRVYCSDPACQTVARHERARKLGFILTKKASRRGEGEVLLEPHLLKRGWVIQHPVKVQGHTFFVDFAKPDSQLYIEADGHPHRITKEKDAKRDHLLAEAGWMGLHFWNSEIRDNLQGVLKSIWQ